MTARAFLFMLALAVFAPVAPAQAQAPIPTPSCAPYGGMDFICDAHRPEDLIRLPGMDWLIASGFENGAGLKLINTETRGMALWYTGAKAQIRQDKRAYPNCPGAPDPALFNVQGIALRDARNAAYTLYAANHGGRESIEIFTVTVESGAAPKLAWNGCVLMPDGYPANSVKAFADGQILATNLLAPGKTIADYTQGRVTGGVYSWRPGEERFRLLPGTELPGNNGIEASPDEKNFYVVSFGLRQVVEFSRADPSKPLRRVEAPGFMPDNLRWNEGRLIAAGLVHDEPACGGVRKVIDGVADPMNCHRGFVAAELDPVTFTFKVVAYGEPNPAFNGTSTAIVIGRNLWLGSWQADRIAIRPLPGVIP